MFYLCFLYLFMHTGAQYNFYIRRYSCRLIVPRLVSAETANTYGAPWLTPVL